MVHDKVEETSLEPPRVSPVSVPLQISEEVVLPADDKCICDERECPHCAQPKIRAFLVDRPKINSSRPSSAGSPPRSPSPRDDVALPCVTPRDRSPVRKEVPAAPRKPRQRKDARMGVRAGSNPLPIRRPEFTPQPWTEGVEMLYPSQRASQSCFCGAKLNITSFEMTGVPGVVAGGRRTLVTCQRGCGFNISRYQPNSVPFFVPLMLPSPQNPWELI